MQPKTQRETEGVDSFLEVSGSWILGQVLENSGETWKTILENFLSGKYIDPVSKLSLSYSSYS